MPALALAPAPVPRINPRSEIELPSVSFFGRSLAEYAQCFALDVAALKGRDVLDVAAGASSFTAEACARKINAVAVDPIYGAPAVELVARVDEDFTRSSAAPGEKPRSFRPRNSAAHAAAELERRAAALRFLADYETHLHYGRYVCGALPRLPFFDGTFDVVLCAHRLFGAANPFDFEWHLAACRELARVSAEDTRIFPLCDASGRQHPALPRLRRELREAGIASEVRAVDYGFFAGANSMLVLRRAAP